MATTLAQLKTRSRERVDKENSTYISDSELTSYINASYAELYDLLIESYEDYFITGPTSFSLTTSDAGVSALPSDFYKLKGIDYQSGGDFLALHTYNWNERNSRNRQNRLNRNRDYIRTYRIIGDNVRIEPDDNAVGDYRIWYVPAFTALSSDSDVVNSTITRNNWEEYIVIDAGIKMLNKEESNATHLEREKKNMTGRIIRMASERDIDQPERITNSDIDQLDGFHNY